MGNLCGGGGNNKEPKKPEDKPKKDGDGDDEDKNSLKLLLLGSGESGKSTIFKQIQNIHKSFFTEETRKIYTSHVHQNLLESMINLSKAVKDLQLKFDEDNVAFADKVIALEEEEDKEHMCDTEFLKKLGKLWTDKGIQEALKQRNKFQLFDSTEYLYGKINEIAKEDYVPTLEDVIKVRSKTTGISSNKFTVGGQEFVIYDVGGQRNERKKWVNCFKNVKLVLFVVSLSEYDLLLYEDEETKRMKESLDLFETVSNNTRHFHSTPIVLIFNKIDLFREKIKNVDLTVAFDDYDGGKDADKAYKFIVKKYKAKCKDKSKPIYTVQLCAHDQKMITDVFDEFLVQKVYGCQAIITNCSVANLQFQILY